MFKCDFAGCTGHGLGKFSTCLEEALWEMGNDYADETTGTVEFQGHYSLFIFAEPETWHFDDGTVFDVAAGNYILGEDDRGFVWVESYASEDEARKVFEQRDQAYGQWSCEHSWVAGMMHVSPEDVESVAGVREVTCEYCDAVYQA